MWAAWRNRWRPEEKGEFHLLLNAMANEEAELQEAVRRIVESKSIKKLIVAGPGAGKTTLFKELLKVNSGGRDDRLVLTFINTLKSDLEAQLSDSAKVFTLHGYCFGFFIVRKNFGMACPQNFGVNQG